MYRRPNILFLCTLLIVVIGASICFIAACGTGKKEVKNDSEDTWQGVITLWDFPRWPDKNGNRFAWIQKKIKEFEGAHPGVFIHFRPLKWEYGHIELRAAAAAGTNPDIAPVASDYDFISGGYLEPVDEYFSAEELAKYDPRAIESVKFNERFYGFPWFMTTYGLFINRELFAARDIDIPEDGQWTYDEFVSALQQVTSNGKKNKSYGFNLFLSPGNYQVWGFLTMDGAKIFDEYGNFALNSPEGVSALTKLVDLAAKYQVVPSGEFGNLEETKVWGDFSEKQRIAVYPAGTWAIKVLRDRYESGKGFEFDIMHYPKGKAEPFAFAQVSGYAIFKQQDERKKDMCAEFIKFITSEEEQASLENYGVFPVYTEALKKSTEDPMMKKMKEILDMSESLPKVKNWHKVEEELSAQIRLALLSQKTPAQALEDAEKNINRILSKAD